jgi:hypothetical protein
LAVLGFRYGDDTDDTDDDDDDDSKSFGSSIGFEFEILFDIREVTRFETIKKFMSRLWEFEIQDDLRGSYSYSVIKTPKGYGV